MKKMLTFGKRLGLGLVAVTACAATAAPFLPLGLGSSDSTGGGGDDETTISVRGQGDESPTVIRTEDMRVGEVQSYTSASGKPITLTRTEEGYTIKLGEKEFKVRAGGDGETFLHGGPGVRKIVVMDGSGKHGDMVFSGVDDGLPGETKMRKVWVGEGGEHGFAFRTGDGASKSFKDVLSEQKLKSLEGLDPKTRDAVTKALEELAGKGVIVAPMCDLPVRVMADGKDDDHVEIKVIRKKTTDQE